MADRAVFLDRDNTIIEDKEGYLGDASKVKLLAGAAAAITALRRLGYKIIIVSNQSGVGRGLITETDVEAVNQEMCRQLREQAAAHIDASYYCPYHPEAVISEYRLDHDWRKPKPGMILQAAEDFELDLKQCWMIGDALRDVAAGAAAGCRTILIQDAEHKPLDHDGATAAKPDFTATTLADAARIVAREGGNVHPELALPVAEKSAEASDVRAAAEAKLADKVARQLEKRMAKPENVRPLLEEIAGQLRQMNRAREMPEYSLGRMMAMIVQALVVGCVVVAGADVWLAVSDGAADSKWAGHMVMMSHAVMWMLGGVVLQGIVLALYMRERNQ